jgi:hypothetical protein
MTIAPERRRPRSAARLACSIWGRRMPPAAALAVLLAAGGSSPAGAVIVGGGGSSRTDCLAVLDAPVNDPVRKPKNIRCTDGDPSCDADGIVNGVCEFPIAVCANSTSNPSCTLNGVQTMTVDHAADNGDPKFDPEFQALQNRVLNEIDPPTTTSDVCANPTTFHVAIKGPLSGKCKKNRKLLKITTLSTLSMGHAYKDKDRIKMTCDPAANGCDPQILFSGTFDRIQTQIFNASCAVSGCHDSQSRTGNLLLEVGASLTNLVNVTPNNPAAAAAGWKRVTVVDPSTGDPGTSLLVAKLQGPPSGFGARMPFGRPKLDQSLIDVVQLWIAAGAPDTGWVPGTDQ